MSDILRHDVETPLRTTPQTKSRTVGGIQLQPNTIVDISDLLGADSFSISGEEVTFTMRGGPMPMRWTGRMGDWLVPEGANFWRIVEDAETA